MYNCTGMQVYRCASLDLYRCVGLHLYRCTGVQVSVACLLSPTERRTHKHTNLTRTPHARTARCHGSHNCRSMCRCHCAAVEYGPNPDPQPVLFSVSNCTSATCSVHAVFLLHAVRCTGKCATSRLLHAQLGTAFTLCQTPCITRGM